MTDEVTSIMKGKPFIYVSGRCLLRTTPKEDFLPYCITKTKGEEIAMLEGQKFDIGFYSSSRICSITREMYSTFALGKATLLGTDKIKIADTDKEFDRFYRFLMQAEDTDFLKKIALRRDEFIDSESAFQRFVSHWGMERWSCLTLYLKHGGKEIFRTDIDVFAPEQKQPLDLFVLGLYSHKPD